MQPREFNFLQYFGRVTSCHLQGEPQECRQGARRGLICPSAAALRMRVTDVGRRQTDSRLTHRGRVHCRLPPRQIKLSTRGYLLERVSAAPLPVRLRSPAEPPAAMKIRDRKLLFVASCALVQSVTWFVLSLLGILIYTCSIDLPDNPDPAALFGARLAKFYIADDSCGEFNRNLTKWLTPPEGVLIINGIVVASSSLWFIASILLIWEAVRVTEQRRVWMLWSWVAITAFICLSDLGTFINFTVDYCNTVSRVRTLQRYRGSLRSDALDRVSLDAESLLAAPVSALELLTYSAFMMSMAARGYMLWLLNVAAALWVGFQALSGGCRGDQEERASLKRHFLSSLYNERQDKVDGLSPPWAVQSPVVGTAPRLPPWAAGAVPASSVAPSYEIPRPFRLGPPPPGRPRPTTAPAPAPASSGAIPEPDYDNESVSLPLGALRSPPHAADALRRQPPPLDEMPRRSALKKAPPSRYAGKTVF